VSVETYFQQRAERFHALYEEEAAWPRWLNHWLRAGLYERAEIASREVTAFPGASVLDVGCGSGRNSVLFIKAGAGRVLGIDMAENMVNLARQFSRKNSTSDRTEFICADFMQYGSKERFDHAVALGVFDYIAEPVAALAKMASLAREKVVASFPGRSAFRAPFRKLRYAMRGCPVYFYTEADLRSIFTQAGMPQAKIVTYASSGFMGIAELSAARTGCP
jgi:SAM-dependent methyltransferase